jgi:hypothetical protein
MDDGWWDLSWDEEEEGGQRERDVLLNLLFAGVTTNVR